MRKKIAFGCLALLLVGPRIDAAPPLVCFTVAPGDTAALLAYRLTGTGRSEREALFQIYDPATATRIPKVRYAQLQPGWRACVAHANYTPPRSADRRAIATPGGSVRDTSRRLANIIVPLGWWWFPIVMSASALIWTLADVHADRRRKTSMALEHFGKTFVREFERPLIEQSTRVSAVRSRLKVSPEGRRLEILLAPGDGRRYPNLSDHRKNLEYDVNRVITVLADRRFVLDDLGAQGPWVVIPFRLDTSLKKAGWS